MSIAGNILRGNLKIKEATNMRLQWSKLRHTGEAADSYIPLLLLLRQLPGQSGVASSTTGLATLLTIVACIGKRN